MGGTKGRGLGSGAAVEIAAPEGEDLSLALQGLGSKHIDEIKIKMEMGSKASWRMDPPTEEQKAYAESLLYELGLEIPNWSKYTKGKVSDLINDLEAVRRKIQKKRREILYQKCEKLLEEQGYPPMQEHPLATWEEEEEDILKKLKIDEILKGNSQDN